ncbi:hypothetical protein [Paenibacillus mucilaginosus]|nr:hypothetical protein [Paenibacillus mucilaginosus]AEI41011.1 hypothetical protein KNP414_02450 [Paenibacillus mucilaginosus KNP414]AFK65239.1 hypothetical protein [Paenibacillus mucilaginosus K02]MCG7211544.1 hypothetical protein [Paenibacillus mucilaginosus]
MMFKMIPKKIRTLSLALACVLALPYGSAMAAESAAIPTVEKSQAAPAGAGEWDYVGSSTFTYSSAVAKSAGGDFLVCLESGPSGYYNLYEDDPDGNADERVGYVYLYAGACGAFRSIGGFVDGDNNRAEFYVYKAFGGTATVSFYD